MRVPAVLFVCAIVATACGDNRGASGPQPLVADPAVQSGCLPGPVTGTRAKVVACDDELIGGRLAGGRVGDFVIENANLRAIVRGPGEGYYQHGSSGGGLVDIASVGGEDLIKEIQPSVELAVGAFDELVITEAGDTGPAEIVVRGRMTSLDVIAAALDREIPPLIMEHHYRLAADAHELEIETRVFPVDGGELGDYTVFEAMFTGGRARAFLPGKGWASGQGAAEMIATSGTTTSYGFVYPADTPNPQLIDLGGIRLIQAASVSADGLVRWIVVGDGSVSSVTDEGWRLVHRETGTVMGTTAPGASVLIQTGDDIVTIARGAADGSYQAAVPPGAYSVHAEADGHAIGASAQVTVDVNAVVTAAAPVGAAGTLVIHVKDDALTPLPARVEIEQQGYDHRIEYTGASGMLTLAVPPGTCRVTVARGLEYEAYVASALAITDGQTQSLDITLDHVVDTSGWISMDTHLHSENSTDSTFPLDDRLRAVAGEGVEVPVSTDHDFITEYAPIIAELGLSQWINSLDGEEVSSIVWGHTNAFPLVADPALTARGGAHWLHKSPAEVYAYLHSIGGGGRVIVQANHPRRGPSDLFEVIDLDPATLTAHRDPTELGLPAGTNLSELGFDAIEVANRTEQDSFETVFSDYLAMVAAGHPAAATGSTDSHGPARFAGEARTYVYVGSGADVPSTVSPTAITDAIHNRHVTVATGAFVTAGIVTGATTSIPGDVVDVHTGTPVKLHIKVQAPPWQPVSGIRIYEKTQQVQSVALDTNDTTTVRYDSDITLAAPAADTFYVVRVDLGGAGDPVLDTSMPSFTNPVFAHVVP